MRLVEDEAHSSLIHLLVLDADADDYFHAVPVCDAMYPHGGWHTYDSGVIPLSRLCLDCTADVDLVAQP